MTIGTHPGSADVLLKLSDVGGAVHLDVVDSEGNSKPFGTLLTFSDGGGHVEAKTVICAADLGFERENERLKVTPA